VFIEAKDDGSGGDSWSYWSCKTPVKSLPPTNQHLVFLQAGCPSCRQTNSVKALKEKYRIPRTCLPQAHLRVFQLCIWTLIAPGYLGKGCHALSALWFQYPLYIDQLLIKIILKINVKQFKSRVKFNWCERRIKKEKHTYYIFVFSSSSTSLHLTSYSNLHEVP